MAIHDKIKLNTILEDRSKLTLIFDQNGTKIIRRISFFENPIIQESQRANYAKYQPLGRAGTIFAYTGSESRSFKVSFNLTHPHIESMMTGSYFKNLQTNHTPTKDQEKATFFQEGTFLTAKGDFDGKNHEPSFSAKMYDLNYLKKAGYRNEEYNDIFAINENAPPYPDTGSPADRLAWSEEWGPAPVTPIPRDTRGLDIINYWVNLVRSSTINDATNTLNPPPLVRLTHGILYRNLPCICTDISIAHNEIAGYDNKTLLPRVIMISMNLSETRLGNYGKFDLGLKATSLDRDNLAGWESIINEPYTIDPQEDKYHNRPLGSGR